MTREYTDACGEISGFGGDYERACRAMVLAGMEWFDAHPGATPRFKHHPNLYGMIWEDNADAKALTEAVVNAKLDGGKVEPTGAMHQACVGHVLMAHENGWEWYIAEMEKPDEEDAV